MDEIELLKLELAKKMAERDMNTKGQYVGSRDDMAERAKAVPQEMNSLHAEAERVCKLAYTLTDRLAAVLRQTPSTSPQVDLVSKSSMVPMGDELAAIRGQVSEAANMLVSLMDRLEL